MDKPVVVKPLQWPVNKKIFNKKFLNPIKMMELFQEQSKIYGI